MKGMFAGARRLVLVNGTGWDVSRITDFSSMFEDCIVLEKVLGLDKWVVSGGVRNVSHAFAKTKVRFEPGSSEDLKHWFTPINEDEQQAASASSLRRGRQLSTSSIRRLSTGVDNLQGMFYQAPFANPNTTLWQTQFVTDF
eukprot:GSA120T00018095001.1